MTKHPSAGHPIADPSEAPLMTAAPAKMGSAKTDEPDPVLPDPASKSLDDIETHIKKAKAAEAKALDLMGKKVKALGDVHGNNPAVRKAAKDVADLHTALAIHSGKVQEAHNTLITATDELNKALTP